MKSLSLGIALTAILTAPTFAQTYPSRTITMIVPFAAGGPTDTVARVTAETMGRLLKQTVIVENVAGAGGTVGSNRVAKAAPDGYTILLNHLGLATALSLYRKLPFDPVTELMPVGMVSDANMVVISRPNYAPKSLAELVKDAKGRGENVTFGHAGVGSSSQLCGLLFISQLGTKLTQVPFRGGGPVLQALLADQVDLACEQATSAAPQLQAKTLKGFAVTSEQRLPELPDIPTVEEAGLPGMEISVWHGLFVPAKTLEPVVESLSRALASSLADERLVKRFADISTIPTPTKANSEALSQVLKSEIERWGKLIRDAGQFAD